MDPILYILLKEWLVGSDGNWFCFLSCHFAFKVLKNVTEIRFQMNVSFNLCIYSSEDTHNVKGKKQHFVISLEIDDSIEENLE